MQYKENQFTLDLLEYIYNIKQFRYVYFYVFIYSICTLEQNTCIACV